MTRCPRNPVFPVTHYHTLQVSQVVLNVLKYTLFTHWHSWKDHAYYRHIEWQFALVHPNSSAGKQLDPNPNWLVLDPVLDSSRSDRFPLDLARVEPIFHGFDSMTVQKTALWEHRWPIFINNHDWLRLVLGLFYHLQKQFWPTPLENEIAVPE